MSENPTASVEKPNESFTVEHLGKKVEVSPDKKLSVVTDRGEVEEVTIYEIDGETISYERSDGSLCLAEPQKDFEQRLRSLILQENLANPEPKEISVSKDELLKPGHLFRVGHRYTFPLADGEETIKIVDVKVSLKGNPILIVKRSFPPEDGKVADTILINEINEYTEAASFLKEKAQDVTNKENDVAPVSDAEAVPSPASETDNKDSTGPKNETLAEQLQAVKEKTKFREEVELPEVDVQFNGEDYILSPGDPVGIFHNGQNHNLIVSSIIENSADGNDPVCRFEGVTWSMTVSELVNAVHDRDDRDEKEMLQGELAETHGELKKGDRCDLAQGDKSSVVIVHGFAKRPGTDDFYTFYKDSKEGGESEMQSMKSDDFEVASHKQKEENATDQSEVTEKGDAQKEVAVQEVRYKGFWFNLHKEHKQIGAEHISITPTRFEEDRVYFKDHNGKEDDISFDKFQELYLDPETHRIVEEDDSENTKTESEKSGPRIMNTVENLRGHFREGDKVIIGDDVYEVSAIVYRNDGTKGAPSIEYSLNGQSQEPLVAGALRQKLRDAFALGNAAEAEKESADDVRKKNGYRQKDEDFARGPLDAHDEDSEFHKTRANELRAQKKAGKKVGKKVGEDSDTIKDKKDDDSDKIKDMPNEQPPTPELLDVTKEDMEKYNYDLKYNHNVDRINTARQKIGELNAEIEADGIDEKLKGQKINLRDILNREILSLREENEKLYLHTKQNESDMLQAQLINDGIIPNSSSGSMEQVSDISVNGPKAATTETTEPTEPKESNPEQNVEKAYGSDGVVKDLREIESLEENEKFPDESLERSILDNADAINDLETRIALHQKMIADKKIKLENGGDTEKGASDEEIIQWQKDIDKLNEKIDVLKATNEGLFKDLTEQRKEKLDPESEGGYDPTGLIKILRKLDEGDGFSEGSMEKELLKTVAEIDKFDAKVIRLNTTVEQGQGESDEAFETRKNEIEQEVAKLQAEVNDAKEKFDRLCEDYLEQRRQAGDPRFVALKDSEIPVIPENESGKEKPGADAEKALSPEMQEKKDQLDLAREAYVQADRRRMRFMKLRRKLGSESGENGDSEGENGALSEYHSARKNYDEAMSAYLGHRVDSGEDFESISNSLKTEEYLKLVEVRDEQRSEIKIPLNLYNVAKGALDKYQKLSLAGKVGIIMTGVGAGIAGGTVGAAAAGVIAMGMRAASTASLATAAKGFMNNKINQGAERFSEANAEKAIEQANKESTEKYLEILQSQFRSELENSEVANNKKMLATITAVAGAAATSFALGSLGKYLFGAENAVATDTSVEDVDLDSNSEPTMEAQSNPEPVNPNISNEMGIEQDATSEASLGLTPEDIDSQDNGTPDTESPLEESNVFNDSPSVSESSVDMIDSEVHHEIVPIHESLSHTLLHTLKERALEQGASFPENEADQWAKVIEIMNENAQRLAPDQVAALPEGDPPYKVFDVIQEGVNLNTQFNVDGSVEFDIQGDYSAVESSAPEVAEPTEPTETSDAIDLYEEAGGSESAVNVSPEVIAEANPGISVSEAAGSLSDAELLGEQPTSLAELRGSDLREYISSATQELQQPGNEQDLADWKNLVKESMEEVFQTNDQVMLGILSRVDPNDIGDRFPDMKTMVDANLNRFSEVLRENLPSHVVNHLENSSTSTQSFIGRGLAVLHEQGIPFEAISVVDQQQQLDDFFSVESKSTGQEMNI